MMLLLKGNLRAENNHPSLYQTLGFFSKWILVHGEKGTDTEKTSFQTR